MKIDRELLLQKLQLLAPGLATREMLEHSTCFIFDGDRAFTFNDEIACQIELGLGLDLTGPVRAKPLMDVLARLPDEHVTLLPQDGSLRVKAKRKTAAIAMEERSELSIESIEAPKKWRVLPTTFLEAVELVKTCCGTDEEQWNLTCVHVTPDGLEACDRFQAARFKMEMGIPEACLLRRTSLEAAVTLGVTKFANGTNWFHFQNPKGLIMSCRRETGDFPNVKKLLKTKGELFELPKALHDATERAEIFSKTDENDLILLTLTRDSLRVRGEGAFGWYSEVRKVEYSGPDMAFRISPAILKSVVKQHSTCTLTPASMKISNGAFQYTAALGEVENES